MAPTELDATIHQAADGAVDWWRADPFGLHYDYFQGDVAFVVGAADFSARWKWVPVLGFAFGVGRLISALEPGDLQSFEFTESPHGACAWPASTVAG